jgi:hypothetical protein
MASEWQANTARTIRNLNIRQRDILGALLIDGRITTLERE